MLDKLIVMLTHNDVTVPDAKEIFEDCKDLPVVKWGFKDVGMPPEEMKELTDLMRAAGKTSFLEVVSYDEAGCMRGAELAVECGFDFLVGTIFYDSVFEYIKSQGLKYCPFVGDVSGSPSVLNGKVEDFLAQEADFASKGVYGTNILGFRHADKANAGKIASEYIEKAKLPVVLAGSIGSEERLEEVRIMDPWAFTMGGALFTGNFVKDGTVRENLAKVCEILK